SAYCWGRNTDGELGTGSFSPSLVPGAVIGSITFAAVSAGSNFTCGVSTSSAPYCWGNNAVGNLGDGTTIDRNAPVPVNGNHQFSSISAGSQHACGIEVSARAALCWGDNASGQLGDGSRTPRSTPVPVTGGPFVAVAAG